MGASRFSLTQDIENISESNSKYGWRMMCLSMKEMKMIIGFFQNSLRSKVKAVDKLLEKIEYYDEEQ